MDRISNQKIRSLSPSVPRELHPAKLFKVLLLENIHPIAKESFASQGLSVDLHKTAFTEEQLMSTIGQYHIVGIRSKTKLTKKVLDAATNLIGIGCFCIGTDQVDLLHAQAKGIPVFHSPFCNSRSVAELMISEIIALSRKLPDKIRQMHAGIWKKSAIGCHEVRGKVLSIIGYGHIGSQLSVLAEALGMKVIFYDVAPTMPLGNAISKSTMQEALAGGDFVTLHVPSQPKPLIHAKEIAQMKKGSYLINASRGNVVVLEDLADALKSGHLAGAAVDVYPVEPSVKNAEGFITPLTGLDNVILTPHQGGSTEEAQAAIGKEMAEKICDFLFEGTTFGSVNYPNIVAPFAPNTHRLLNFHKNEPGVLAKLNGVFAGYNVSQQILRTSQSVGLFIVDVDHKSLSECAQQISGLSCSLKTRILY